MSEEGELEPGPSECSGTSYHSTTSNFATVEDLNNSLSPNSMRHSSSTGAPLPASNDRLGHQDHALGSQKISDRRSCGFLYSQQHTEMGRNYCPSGVNNIPEEYIIPVLPRHVFTLPLKQEHLIRWQEAVSGMRGQQSSEEIWAHPQALQGRPWKAPAGSKAL